MSDAALNTPLPGYSGIRRVTGPQPGAIAVFRIAGRPALELAQRHLRLRRSGLLWELPLDAIAFGYWQHGHCRPDDDRVSPPGEDVVFCRTGEDLAELHTHGGLAIADSLFATFRAAGLSAAPYPPGAAEETPASTRLLDRDQVLGFLEPAWFAGWADHPQGVWQDARRRLAAAHLPPLTTGPVCHAGPTQADATGPSEHLVETTLCGLHGWAYEALSRSQASEVGRILWDQLRGNLLHCLLEIADVWTGDRQRGVQLLDQWLATWSWGQYLSREIRVLVMGAPNVGKSSLINALVGYQRAVVSPTPGTTRDLVGQGTALAGWQFRLWDSAGLRLTEDPLERQGIERAWRARGDVDLVIVVRAVDESPSSTESQFGAESESGRDLPRGAAPCLTVVNKVDLLEEVAAREPGPVAMATAGTRLDLPPNAIGVSAVTGAGLADLVRAIITSVLPVGLTPAGANDPAGVVTAGSPQAPGCEGPGRRAPTSVVFSPEMGQWLTRWRNVLADRRVVPIQEPSS